MENHTLELVIKITIHEIKHIPISEIDSLIIITHCRATSLSEEYAAQIDGHILYPGQTKSTSCSIYEDQLHRKNLTKRSGNFISPNNPHFSTVCENVSIYSVEKHHCLALENAVE